MFQKLNIFKYISLCITCMAAVCMFACTPAKLSYVNTQNNAYSSSRENLRLIQQEKLTRILKSEHIDLIQTGDEVTLILPQKQFFYPNSNHFRSRLFVLDHVVDFINAYPVVDIQVKGYTDNVGDDTRQLALSRAQAEAVLTYLWHHGLNVRLISAQGYGCHNVYKTNHIEIFFRIPPPNNVFH